MKLRRIICGAALAAATVFGVSNANAAATFHGPSGYLSLSDSPLDTSGLGSTFFVENFEDGLLNTPGVTASTGFALPAASFTDSVDGDDGVIDGSGNGGRTWYSNNAYSVTFFFDALVLGSLPVEAGIVWTDVGFSDNVNGFGKVVFEAFDSLGVSLGTLGPADLGDGVFNGGTDEDRFFGVSYAGGISKITFSMLDSNDWEMDHVQYGLRPIPEPASMALLGMGALALVARPRRRR